MAWGGIWKKIQGTGQPAGANLRHIREGHTAFLQCPSTVLLNDESSYLQCDSPNGTMFTLCANDADDDPALVDATLQIDVYVEVGDPLSPNVTVALAKIHDGLTGTGPSTQFHFKGRGNILMVIGVAPTNRNSRLHASAL